MPLCGSPVDTPHLIYIQQTGEVVLDGSRSCIFAYVLGTESGSLNTSEAKFPFIDIGTNTDNTSFQIGQFDPILSGFQGHAHLGPILPLGMDDEQLNDFLTTARFAFVSFHDDFIITSFDLDDIGDTDLDGDVDTVDRTTLIENWTGAKLSIRPARRTDQGDFDFDGDVDAADATLMLRHWTGAQGQFSIVPEPSGEILALVATVLTLQLSRSRGKRINHHPL